MFPEVLSITTYPVVSVLEIMLYGVRKAIARGEGPSVHVVELIAAFERLLAIGFTGNLKAMDTKLMRNLMMEAGIKNKGFPTVDRRVVPLDHGSQMINMEMWPMDGDTDKPMTASRASQLFHYGEEHYQV